MPSRFDLVDIPDHHRLDRNRMRSIAHLGSASQTRPLAAERNREAELSYGRGPSMLRYRHGWPLQRSRRARRRRPCPGTACLTVRRSVERFEVGCERPGRARIAHIMLLQKQVQRDGEASLGKPAGAVMTRRAAVGEQPCRRLALVEVLGPRGRIRDEKKDANKEQSEHHSAKPALPADRLHTLNSFLPRRYAMLGADRLRLALRPRRRAGSRCRRRRACRDR